MEDEKLFGEILVETGEWISTETEKAINDVNTNGKTPENLIKVKELRCRISQWKRDMDRVTEE
jgi:hypothetical protein